MQKTKERYHNGGDEKESTEYCPANKDVLKEKAKSSIETTKKKKQKENLAKVDTKGWEQANFCIE